ncbi:TadE/TadG family type IV pilus assembly protein [Blastomonas sp.]|uniref:TadE/TadG family type IV pilus assembly protein n=1 Tax=Blastomonas sp. TaxID=1909299 RepID=UPI00263476D7|nr:TadE family protein [Blastomonas sp.]MDM7955635.1 pilus assembly protein [Blastomonas sp.]
MLQLGFIRRAAQDRRGVTATEFGLIAPTFIMLLLGVFDMGYNVYARAILDGAVQKAGRDSALETGADSIGTLDAKVTENLGPLANGAVILPRRRNYRDFAKVGLPEDFEDKNSNGQRDAGECFTDENANGTWDADLGKEGVGNARDVVLYTVTMTYQRKFPLYNMIGMSSTASITSATVLRNQPYADQGSETKEVICT